MSGRDALFRAGAAVAGCCRLVSEAKLPGKGSPSRVLLRGILSDFSLIMAQAQASPPPPPPPYADIAAVAMAVYLTLLLVELTAALVGGPADFCSL